MPLGQPQLPGIALSLGRSHRGRGHRLRGLGTGGTCRRRL